MSRIPDLDDFLDPKTLTPQGLYRLQSETWSQGAEAERERILKQLQEQRESIMTVLEGNEFFTEAAYGYLQAIEHSEKRIKGNQK
jgi:hypothetical protein